jgi:RNA polymerase sigma factor (sigma-70 family)
MARRPARRTSPTKKAKRLTARKDKAAGEIDRAYVRQRKSLRAVARRAGGQDDEDLVQDAFVRVVERSRFEEIPKLDNFVAHVVRCFAIDRIRRRDRRSTFVSSEAGENAVDPAADPERSLMGAQRLQRVLAAIDAMPPRRREVFLMHRVEDLTYGQIARRLNVSVKAVQKHVYAAMRQLSDTDD